jgi:hypothetical protein
MCAERGVAMQTIKSIALAPWDGRPKTANTWYEPLTDPADIEVAVRWVLARPEIFLNTVGDVNLLPHVLAAAERFDVDSRRRTRSQPSSTTGSDTPGNPQHQPAKRADSGDRTGFTHPHTGRGADGQHAGLLVRQCRLSLCHRLRVGHENSALTS